MNVTPIVNTGLRFDLKHYQALKTSYAGTTLWFVNNSELLRNKLYPFLPRMEYDAGSGTVTASIVENGRELLSTSESATPSLNNVPVSELQKLENLIRDLLAEAAKSDTPDNVKQLVNAFPLPKPNSMPECYRLYGTGPNKRLAIVWGLARKDAEGNEDVSSVVSLKDFTYGLEYTPKKSYTWLWILLGIAAAGIGIYYTSGHQQPPGEGAPVIDVLREDQKQLPVPRQLEILRERETAVAQQISEIEAKQNELREKLATMDQQSAEAEASHKELADLLARHKALKAELDAIRTTREKLENPTGGGQGSDTINEEAGEIVVLTDEQKQLPVPRQLEILRERETAVAQQISEIEAKQNELREKLATMDQQSAEAEASHKELADLLARHKALKAELDAIRTTREKLENPTGVGQGSDTINEEAGEIVVLTDEQKQLPVPRQLEILRERETAVAQQISEIEAKQNELREKLATMDQQSAEAEASHKELADLLARHKALKAELDAIRTTREKLENPTGVGQGSDTINEEETSGVTPEDGVKVPSGVTTEGGEEKPTVVPPADGVNVPPADGVKETSGVTTEGGEEKPTVVPPAGGVNVPPADGVKVPSGVTTEGGEEKPTVVPPAGGANVPPADGVKVPSGVTTEGGEEKPTVVPPAGGANVPPADGVKVPSGVTTEGGEEKPTVVPPADGPSVVTPEDVEEEPTVVEPYSPLTEAEKQLPVPQQLEVLDRKEKKVEEEVNKLESEQAKLQEELEAIAEKQKHSAEVADKLTKLLREYEALAAELKRDDISPEERARLTERKKELEEEIAQAESQLETVPYNEKKARLDAIDQQLEENKEKIRQIDQAREALQSSVVPREINVEIYKADDYKVTHISHEAIAGSDKVRLKLNISALNANLKFTRITVGGVQANTEGDVEIVLTNESQKLQLKIWVDNDPDPRYVTPIYVNKSVIEKSNT